MRRRTCILITAAAAALAAPLAAQATPAYTITGRGWGHGIGLSQYGAQGRALAGQTRQQILAFYYPTATIATTPVTSINVLLQQRAAVAITIPAGAKLRTNGVLSSDTAIAAGPWTARFLAGNKVRLTKNGTTTHKDGAQLRLIAPAAGSSFLAVQGRTYRGDARLLPKSGSLVQAINVVPLNSYLRGVVPSEMLSSWRQPALRAQAIAARSYAVAERAARQGSGSPFDVYADTRSQMYLGVPSETAATDQAVAVTKLEVLNYAGKTISAYFSASNGGQTASVADEWGSTPVPYLVSRPDPYDRPTAPAGIRQWPPIWFSAGQLGTRLGIAPVASTVSTINGSLRIKTIVFTPTAGAPISRTGAQLRTLLGLKSTYFRLRMVDLKSVARATDHRVKVVSVANPGGWTDVQVKSSGQPWQTLAKAIVKKGVVRTWYLPAATTGSVRVVVGQAISTVKAIPAP